MTNHTKNGLFILMISIILSIVGSIILCVLWSSINWETITYDNFLDIFITIIPALVIAAIGGILGLVGAIFIFLGRKEFGEKHRKYINYALIIIIISIVFGFISGIITSAIRYSSQSQSIFGTHDTNDIIESFRTSTTISSITTPIGSAIGGLVWVFGLYNLEDEKGRRILIAAYITMIVVAIAVAISTMMFYDQFINSAVFQEMLDANSTSSSAETSQIFSSLQYLGNTLLISTIGGIFSNLLILYALYIPHCRIKSGELVPDSSYQNVIPGGRTGDRICPTCGRVIPFDAMACPYCGRKF